MRRSTILLLVVLSACSQTGEVVFFSCPDCSSAYDGFSTCAFFDADAVWARPEMLVDDRNFAGVGVPIAQDGYMHHKFCFNDSHVAFGSANPTVRGLTCNDNYVIHMESNSLVHAFRTEYETVRDGGLGLHRIRHTLNGKTLEVRFCPRDHCEDRVVQVLASANSSIAFLAFSFTSDAIGDALYAAHLRDVHVEGVFNPLSANGRGSEYARLREAGMDVRLAETECTMHAKAFLVDEKVAIVGSYNPTKNANEKNAETLVITTEDVVVAGIEELIRRHAS